MIRSILACGRAAVSEHALIDAVGTQARPFSPCVREEAGVLNFPDWFMDLSFLFVEVKVNLAFPCQGMILLLQQVYWTHGQRLNSMMQKK